MKNYERAQFTEEYDAKEMAKISHDKKVQREREHQAFLKRMHMTEEQYQALNKR